MDKRLQIVATGRYVPERVIPNSHFFHRDMYQFDILGNKTGIPIRTNDEWIKQRMGVSERRYASESWQPSDLGVIAATNAINKAERQGLDRQSITGIIFATLTQEKNVATGAVKIQEKLGLRGCFAYDLNNECAGFSEALAQANSRVLRRCGSYLVVVADKLSGIIDPLDANTPLFGDGAAAVVLSPTNIPGRGILQEISYADPFDGNLYSFDIDCNRKLRMNGGGVLKRAIKGMKRGVNEIITLSEWQNADRIVIIPHQANIRIIEPLEESVKEVLGDRGVVYKNIQNYGNMSAASIPFALDEAIEKGVVKQDSKLIFVSFGAGDVHAYTSVQLGS